jgi:hypothetical protein
MYCNPSEIISDRGKDRNNIKLDRITSITQQEPSRGVRNRIFPPKTRRYTRRRMP